jgi:hypothetical protein
MDKVLFDAGSATANATRGLGRTSRGQRDYTQVASGYGTNRVIQADLQGSKNGRYPSGQRDLDAVVVHRRCPSSAALADRGGWATSVGASPAAMIDGNVEPGGRLAHRRRTGSTSRSTWGPCTLDNDHRHREEHLGRDRPRARLHVALRRTAPPGRPCDGRQDRKATRSDRRAGRPLRQAHPDRDLWSWWSIGELTAAVQRRLLVAAVDGEPLRHAGAQTIIDAHQTPGSLRQPRRHGLQLRAGADRGTPPQHGRDRSRTRGKIDWIVDEPSARGMYALIDLHGARGGPSALWADRS